MRCSWYEFFDRRRSQIINKRLLAYVQQLKQVQVRALAFCLCGALC